MFLDKLIATIGQGLGPEAVKTKREAYPVCNLTPALSLQAKLFPGAKVNYYLNICRVANVCSHSIGQDMKLCSSDKSFLLSRLEWLTMSSVIQTPGKWGQGGHLNWCYCSPALMC